MCRDSVMVRKSVLAKSGPLRTCSRSFRGSQQVLTHGGTSRAFQEWAWQSWGLDVAPRRTPCARLPALKHPFTRVSFTASDKVSPMQLLPLLTTAHALFLDFDGTLTELAPRPEAVRIASGLVPTLSSLYTHLDGALAIVTGRPEADIDGFLAPLHLPPGRTQPVEPSPGLAAERQGGMCRSVGIGHHARWPAAGAAGAEIRRCRPQAARSRWPARRPDGCTAMTAWGPARKRCAPPRGAAPAR